MVFHWPLSLSCIPAPVRQLHAAPSPVINTRHTVTCPESPLPAPSCNVRLKDSLRFTAKEILLSTKQANARHLHVLEVWAKALTYGYKMDLIHPRIPFLLQQSSIS